MGPEARYAAHYDRLMASGLYEALVSRKLLIPHTEVHLGPLDTGAHRVLRPEPLPFVSYPYEWCPGQIRAAALLTLDVLSLALDHGLVLKDASVFNVQFIAGPCSSTPCRSKRMSKDAPGSPIGSFASTSCRLLPSRRLSIRVSWD